MKKLNEKELNNVSGGGCGNPDDILSIYAVVTYTDSSGNKNSKTISVNCRRAYENEDMKTESKKWCDSKGYTFISCTRETYIV